MENNNNASWFIVIPAPVFNDSSLAPNAKLLYGAITQTTYEDGVCDKTNDYFAKKMNMDKKSISRLISVLEERGYIRTEIKKDGSGIVLKREIRCALSHPFLPGGGIHKNVEGVSTELRRGIHKYVEVIKDINNNNITPLTPQGEQGAFFEYSKGHPELAAALQGFAQMRKKLRKPLTERAEEILIQKLQELAPGCPAQQVKIVDQSTIKGWPDFYKLDPPADNSARQTKAAPEVHERRRPAKWI